MNHIYHYNKTVTHDRQAIIETLEDDSFIINHFNIIEDIEYLSKNKRKKGTQFRISLNLRDKIFKFKNEIIQYDTPSEYSIITFTKYGKIISHMNLEEEGKETKIDIMCEIDNNHLSTKLILKIMQPIVKVALDRSINNFLLAAKKASQSQNY